MAIPVMCPGCKATLNAPDAAAGKRVQCSNCRTQMVVPSPEPENAFAFQSEPEPNPESPKSRSKPEEKKAPANRKLVAGIAAGFAVLAGIVIAVVAMSGGKNKKEIAKADPPAKKATPAATPKSPRDSKPVEPVDPMPPSEPPTEPPPPVRPPAEPPVPRAPVSREDFFTRAAAFRPDGPLPELPPLPPTAKRPLLALNPGGHTSTVRGVHFTPKADRVVTVSEDKTVRIWDVASGEEIDIFHLPAGPASEGILWASALSTSGKRLAVSGFPLGKGSEGVPIYILNVETGRLEQVILGARETIHSLDFSKDDTLVAAGCGDGIILGFDANTGRKTFTLQHEGIVGQVKFHPKLKRLAGLCSRSAVAVWDLDRPDSALTNRKMATEGPNGIAWSHDGTKLAVGCTNGEVHLLTAEGQPKSVLPPALEKNAPIQIVRLAFLPGDKELVYGGVSAAGWAGIITLADGTRRIQFTEHSNTVMAVNASNDGRFAVSAGGELNETIVWRTSDGAVVRTFAGAGKAVWGIGWAKDGKSIAWGNTNRHAGDGLCPIENTLHLDNWYRGDRPRPGDYGRHVHDDGTHSIEILDFFRFTVKENGRPLYTYEAPKGNRIYSVTLLPDSGIVVGGSGTMILLDRKTGKPVRNYTSDTGLTIALAPSPDGRYFISGSTDQTIRIWRPEQDEPLVSIFTAGREWIAWTPQGYYSCSAYGERLISWQVNDGAGKLPSIHPAVRFRQSLHQPGLIHYLIPAGDLRLALAMAAKFERQSVALVSVNDVLPPEVTISAPNESEITITDEVLTVRATATATGKHPVVAMRLIVDGRPFQGSAGIKRFAAGEKATCEWKVPLSPGIHSLAALAESPVSKALSQPLIATRTGTEPPPNLYVLAVGVSDYPGDLKLRYAASDAERLKKAFSENCKGVFGSVEVKVITDKDATRKGILEGLDWLATKMTTKDVGVFSFSGHGTRDALGRFALVPVDVSEEDPDGTCLSGEEFKKRLENMPGRLIAILDACHSGAVAEAQMESQAGKADGLVRDLLTDDYGVVVMCASLGREFAIESPTTKAGFFTLGLVEGLSGKADGNKDGLIFIHELDFYASLRVNQLSGGRQNPVTGRPPTIRPFAMAKP